MDLQEVIYICVLYLEQELSHTYFHLLVFCEKKKLGDIKEIVDTELDEASLYRTSVPSLDKICVTRWTVRGMKLWETCLKESLLTKFKA